MDDPLGQLAWESAGMGTGVQPHDLIVLGGEVEISFVLMLGSVKVSLTVENRGRFFAMGREHTAGFRVTDSQADRLDLSPELRKAINSLRC